MELLRQQEDIVGFVTVAILVIGVIIAWGR